jgi:hypothetical protein
VETQDHFISIVHQYTPQIVSCLFQYLDHLRSTINLASVVFTDLKSCLPLGVTHHPFFPKLISSIKEIYGKEYQKYERSKQGQPQMKILVEDSEHISDLTVFSDRLKSLSAWNRMIEICFKSGPELPLMSASTSRSQNNSQYLLGDTLLTLQLPISSAASLDDYFSSPFYKHLHLTSLAVSKSFFSPLLNSSKISRKLKFHFQPFECLGR